MSYAVAQVLPALEAGGVERGTVEVARALTAAGQRSIVISAGGRLVKELTATGSQHVQLPIGHKSLLVLRQIPRLREIFSQVDIVHARSRFPAWLSWLAVKGMEPGRRPAFITTVHGAYSVNPYSRIMTRGNRVIAVSDFIHDYITSNYPDCDPDRIITIHRGIDPDVYYQGYQPDSAWLRTWYATYPQLKEKFVMALPGRITRRKGHEDFISAIAGLSNKGMNIHGLIIGGAHPSKKSYTRKLERHVDKAGLRDRITFTGHRDDLREIMSTCQVICCISRQPESFGRTALEALCLGIPVVAYDHGGAGEILRRLFAEGLVPPGEAGGIIQRVETFYRLKPTVSADNPFLLATMLSQTLACYAACRSAAKPDT